MKKMNKKQNKKKKGRQVLVNPLTTDAKVTEVQIEQLKMCLQDKLQQLFSRPFSSAQVLDDLSDTAKKELFDLPKNERAKKLKLLKSQKKSEASKDLLPKEYLSGLVLGLKKCLKGLEQKSLKALLYDSEVNVESIKVLFDKGQIPMLALPGMSGLVRSITGFPALSLGLPAKIQDVKVEAFFEPLMTMINQVPVIVNENVKKENNLPDLVPKKELLAKVEHVQKPLETPLKCPLVTLLKRDSIKDRAWHPPEEVKEVIDEDVFMDDFISFGSKKRSSGQSLKSSKYKKTKLEIMK